MKGTTSLISYFGKSSNDFCRFTSSHPSQELRLEDLFWPLGKSSYGIWGALDSLLNFLLALQKLLQMKQHYFQETFSLPCVCGVGSIKQWHRYICCLQHRAAEARLPVDWCQRGNVGGEWRPGCPELWQAGELPRRGSVWAGPFTRSLPSASLEPSMAIII